MSSYFWYMAFCIPSFLMSTILWLKIEGHKKKPNVVMQFGLYSMFVLAATCLFMGVDQAFGLGWCKDPGKLLKTRFGWQLGILAIIVGIYRMFSQDDTAQVQENQQIATSFGAMTALATSVSMALVLGFLVLGIFSQVEYSHSFLMSIYICAQIVGDVTLFGIWKKRGEEHFGGGLKGVLKSIVSSRNPNVWVGVGVWVVDLAIEGLVIFKAIEKDVSLGVVLLLVASIKLLFSPVQAFLTFVMGVKKSLVLACLVTFLAFMGIEEQAPNTLMAMILIKSVLANQWLLSRRAIIGGVEWELAQVSGK